MNYKIKNDQSSRGFTLLELILGLIIFSIVAALIYSTFSSGVKLSHRAELQNKVYREAHWALHLMSQELENMVPYDFSNSYSNKKSFDGAQDKITFILAGKDGLKVISYYLTSPEESFVHKVVIGSTSKKNEKIVVDQEEVSTRENYLVREETPFVDYLSDGSNQTKKTEVIARNIKENGLRFLYGYGKEGESKEIDWQSQWSLNYIPSNIHIEIDFLLSERKSGVLTVVEDILAPPGFLGKKED